MDDSKLSTYFVRFAEEECKGSCTLYEKLSIEVAKDKQLLDMCLHTRKDQPIPNLFLLQFSICWIRIKTMCFGAFMVA